MRHLQILLIPFSIYFPFSGGCPVIFLNSSLDDCKIISEGEGENTKYYLQKGADTASKKLLGKSTLYIKTGLFHDGGSNVYACTYISEDNKNWVEMEIIKLRPQDEFIKLGQALKAAGLVESGVEAKDVIQNGLVLVNGEIDTRRGRKLYPGDTASFDGSEIKIEK